MKYKIFIIAGLVGLLFSCEREMSPEQADKFIKYYGNFLMDEARDVEILDGGGYAICGIGSQDNQGTRMVLVVTDKYGNLKAGFSKVLYRRGIRSRSQYTCTHSGWSGWIFTGRIC